MAKIVVNARFLTQRITGVQRYAIEVSRRLKRMAPDLRFVAPPGVIHDALAAELAVEQVGRLRGHAWEQLELPRHLNGAGLIGLCNAGPLTVARQIVTLHDAAAFAVPEAYSRTFRTWYQSSMRILGRCARCIITVSRFSADELHRRAAIPARKIIVAPLGHEHVLSLASDQNILNRHGISGQGYLLAVGSSSPHKNFAALVRAARRLAELSFVIVGGADPRIHAATAADVLGNVRHVGAVSDEELRALYENAAGYVHPAYYEGFGLPPLEAMALGCPVLTANAAALPEVAGDAARYFDPFDDNDMVAAIGSFATDAAGRAELAGRGRSRAMLFSWDRCAEQILAAAHETIVW